MHTLYLDLFSGISGDMFIGALLDLGVNQQELERRLKLLPLEGYHLHARRASKCNLEGVKFDVHVGDHHHAHSHAEEDHHHDHGHEHPAHEHSVHGHRHEHDLEQHHHHHEQHHDEHHHHHHHHDEAEHEHGHEHGRNHAEIQQLIRESGLSEWVKTRALSMFGRIAVAEGRIHGVPPAAVEFHEVGAIDSIIDIVGACVALELLGKPRVLASCVTEGTGFVRCAHGNFPIPVPATLAILGERAIPLSQCEEPQELVTPTGAAILAEFVESFGPMMSFAPERVGYGLGTRDNQTRPNVLRAILGKAEAQESKLDWEMDRVTVLETNLDDINPEVLGTVFEQALSMGALDAFYTPVHMKKNRPGVILTLLCAEEQANRFSEFLLRETTAFGVRRYTAERRKLLREFTRVNTPYGEVTMKLGKLNGAIVQAAPEHESCKSVAKTAAVPIRQIYEAALRAFKNS